MENNVATQETLFEDQESFNQVYNSQLFKLVTVDIKRDLFRIDDITEELLEELDQRKKPTAVVTVVDEENNAVTYLRIVTKLRHFHIGVHTYQYAVCDRAVLSKKERWIVGACMDSTTHFPIGFVPLDEEAKEAHKELASYNPTELPNYLHERINMAQSKDDCIKTLEKNLRQTESAKQVHYILEKTVNESLEMNDDDFNDFLSGFDALSMKISLDDTVQFLYSSCAEHLEQFVEHIKKISGENDTVFKAL